MKEKIKEEKVKITKFNKKDFVKSKFSHLIDKFDKNEMDNIESIEINEHPAAIVMHVTNKPQKK